MLTKEISQTIQLVNENCHPDEAWEMLNDLVEERSRQQNLRMWCKREGNGSFDSRPINNNIKEMKTQCRELKMLMEEAKNLGLNIEIKAGIEVRMARKPFHNTVKPNAVSQH